jgi:hypothetical protein
LKITFIRPIKTSSEVYSKFPPDYRYNPNPYVRFAD